MLLPGDRVPTVVADPGALARDAPPARGARSRAAGGERAADARGVLHVRAASAPEPAQERGALPPGVVSLAEWTDGLASGWPA